MCNPVDACVANLSNQVVSGTNEGSEVGDLRVEPVTGALGAVASGIDLATAPREALDALRSALDAYLVLYLPGQALDRFQPPAPTLSTYAHAG